MNEERALAMKDTRDMLRSVIDLITGEPVLQDVEEAGQILKYAQANIDREASLQRIDNRRWVREAN